jgi:hypothetical protein
MLIINNPQIKHFYLNGKQLCNESINPLPHKLVTDKKKVTCLNCNRILGQKITFDSKYNAPRDRENFKIERDPRDIERERIQKTNQEKKIKQLNEMRKKLGWEPLK